MIIVNLFYEPFAARAGSKPVFVLRLSIYFPCLVDKNQLN
jgi:hypothetical protein